MSDEIIEFYYREKLVRRLILTLEDQIEKNRELAIEIMTKAIERVGLKDEAQILLPAISNRMNKIPFNEPCKSMITLLSLIFFLIDSFWKFLTSLLIFVNIAEEVRVALIELLDTCMESDKN